VFENPRTSGPGNTEFVQVVDSTHLKMRVWERGSGETWACGTGTCATVAALTELGVCPAGEDVHVQLRGGELIIRVLPGKKLLMTGSAVTVCEGIAEVYASLASPLCSWLSL
jgi:Diaminopimelate epimerase